MILFLYALRKLRKTDYRIIYRLVQQMIARHHDYGVIMVCCNHLLDQSVYNSVIIFSYPLPSCNQRDTPPSIRDYATYGRPLIFNFCDRLIPSFITNKFGVQANKIDFKYSTILFYNLSISVFGYKGHSKYQIQRVNLTLCNALVKTVTVVKALPKCDDESWLLLLDYFCSKLPF